MTTKVAVLLRLLLLHVLLILIELLAQVEQGVATVTDRITHIVPTVANGHSILHERPGCDGTSCLALRF